MVKSLWHRHPGVTSGSDLTFGQRAADVVRNGMGSWLFVFGFLLVMVAWVFVNSIWIERWAHGRPFDPYPYILLNLMLSTMAGLQGAILLIAAKRADQISSEVALHTERITEDLKTLIAQNNELTSAVHELAKALHDHIIGDN